MGEWGIWEREEGLEGLEEEDGGDHKGGGGEDFEGILGEEDGFEGYGEREGGFEVEEEGRAIDEGGEGGG